MTIRVYVADSPDFGPVVTEVKGIRGGREWLATEIERALAYHADGTIGVQWSDVDIPHSLRSKIVVSQSLDA
jgi:hypothetical protein